jgi:hypothetical protein
MAKDLTMKFLQTQTSGLLAAKHIVLIGAINTRSAGNSYHEIDYAHGGEAKSTRATAEAVNNFFDEIARANLQKALKAQT